MPRTVVRQDAFRGRDAHGNPCYCCLCRAGRTGPLRQQSALAARVGIGEPHETLYPPEAGVPCGRVGATALSELVWEDGLPQPQSDNWSEL